MIVVLFYRAALCECRHLIVARGVVLQMSDVLWRRCCCLLSDNILPIVIHTVSAPETHRNDGVHDKRKINKNQQWCIQDQNLKANTKGWVFDAKVIGPDAKAFTSEINHQFIYGYV